MQPAPGLCPPGCFPAFVLHFLSSPSPRPAPGPVQPGEQPCRTRPHSCKTPAGLGHVHAKLPLALISRLHLRNEQDCCHKQSPWKRWGLRICRPARALHQILSAVLGVPCPKQACAAFCLAWEFWSTAVTQTLPQYMF